MPNAAGIAKDRQCGKYSWHKGSRTESLRPQIDAVSVSRKRVNHGMNLKKAPSIMVKMKKEKQRLQRPKNRLLHLSISVFPFRIPGYPAHFFDFDSWRRNNKNTSLFRILTFYISKNNSSKILTLVMSKIQFKSVGFDALN